MNYVCSVRREGGVITIFVAMVMLLLITLLITTAFSISTTNLKAVGNVQARNEAIASAQTVIEQVILENAGLSAFQTARTSQVDINGDGVNDYIVDVPIPICVRATQANTTSTSSVTLPGFSAGGAWNTTWEINAIATDATTGARVSIIHGVRYLLTNVEKNAVCPT